MTPRNDMLNWSVLLIKRDAIIVRMAQGHLPIVQQLLRRLAFNPVLTVLSNARRAVYQAKPSEKLTLRRPLVVRALVRSRALDSGVLLHCHDWLVRSMLFRETENWIGLGQSPGSVVGIW